MRIAAVNFALRRVRSDSDYFGHLHDLISHAHDEGAEVVVLPELHVLELLPIAGRLPETKTPRFLAQYSGQLEDWFARIAKNSGMTIVTGSHFVERPDGIVNEGVVALPSGTVHRVTKNNLTRYEAEVWGLRHGEGLGLLPSGLGVTICYDSEFPEAGRSLTEAGMTVQAIPAWTETVRGFQRVRWCALARAVENQTFVIHASLVGDFGEEPVPASYGTSAIIAPSVEPFPTDPVLRESPLNEEAVIVADLDFEQLRQARLGGEVSNWEDRTRGNWSVSVLRDEPTPRNGAGELN